MNRSYKVIWNQSLNCFMAVAEYAKSRGKSSCGVVSSASTASAAVSSGARLLRLSALSVGLVTAGFSMQVVAGYEAGGGTTFVNCTRTSNGSGTEAASIAIANEGSIACAPAIEAIAIGANLVAQGEQSTVIGNDIIASSTAVQAVVIGSNFNANPTTSNGAGGVAIGSGLTTTLSSPIANGIGSVAIGSSGNGSANSNSLNGAVASGSHALALMAGASASAANAIAIGSGSNSTGGTAVAVGNSSNSSGTGAIAIGGNSTTKVDNGTQGGQSIAIGFDAQTKGDQSVGLGANVRASGNSSIAIGGDDLNSVAGTNNSSVAAQTYKNLTGDNLIRAYDGQTGPNGQYYGTTSGNGAVAIGVQASALGDLSTSFGTRTQANGIASTALGVGATSSKNGSVALGAGSRTDGSASKIETGAVNGVEFTGFVGNSSFAGTAADAGRQVSVGSIGNERQIKNVAPGELSATSTDAINGSQIYAVSSKLIDNIKAVKTTADAVANGTAGLVKQADNTAPITIGAATGGTILNISSSAGNRVITGVANGTGNNDAANFSQVKAAKSQVAAGTNVTSVVTTAGTNGESIYTVNADKSTVSGSTAVTVTPGTKNANNVTDYAVDLSAATKTSLGKADTAVQTVSSSDSNLTAVKTGNNIAFDFADAPIFTGQVKGNGFDANNNKIVNVTDGTIAANSKEAVNGGQLFTTNQAISAAQTQSNKGFNISAAGGTADNVQLGETVNFTSNDKNLVVTNNGANGINYDLADNIVVNKVTAGDSTFNSAGVTITDGPNNTVTLSGSGLNNGGNRITGLANGIATDDAATFGQLSTTNAAVTDASNIAAGNLAALGGGAKYDAATDTYTVPNYTLNNGATSFNTVGGALSNLDGRTTTNANNITGLQNQTFRLRANTDASTPVASGDTVTFLDGDNVKITRAGNNVTIGTSLNPTFTTVTSTGAVTAGSLNTGGALTVTGASNLNGGANLNNNKIIGVAAGTAATDAVNVGQLTTAGTAVNNKINALGNSTATNLGGGANYNATTGTVSAPAYTLDDGTNTGTNVTATNVGGALDNINTRTTTNTGDIANVQAQANKGFNISAAGGTANNVQLGETVDFTNTDSNLVVTASANGINYNLAKNIDLDTTGSLKTGNTVTNNAGVRTVDGTGNITTVTAAGTNVTDGTYVTAVKARGTNVTDGTSTSNYGANGLNATDKFFGNVGVYNASNMILSNVDGYNQSTASRNILVNKTSTNVSTADYSALYSSAGNNFSTATNNTISNGTRSSTTTSITGTNVTDGTNTSNYGANGLTATDGTNTATLNKTGLSFTDANGATGPSITAAGINAGDQVLTNVGAGSITATSKDAINGSQLFGSAESVKNVIGGNAVNTAGVVTATDIGGTGANTIDGAITNVRDAATKAKTTVTEGKNVTVTSSTNADGSTDYNVRTKDDLALTSVTTGNSVLNNTGLTITGGPSVTTAGINAAGNKVTNVANGTAAGDAVNFGQLTTAGTAVNNKINALGTSTAANLGGGAKYNTATGAVSAPTYTLDDGTNTGTNVTANNVGDALGNLNTRTTTNTGDIADLASGKTGLVRQDNGTGVITVGAATGGTSVNFANSTGVTRQLTGVASAGDYTVAGNTNNAVNAGDLNTAVNSVTDLGLSFAGDSGKNVQRKLGETLNVTGGANTATLTDNNIGVVTNDTNGLIVKLNKDIDLGADGSLKTGNTVTNNAGVTITDGNNITAVTAAGTNVTDGTNTSNYGANGSNIADKSGNTTVTSATGTNVTDGSGNEASYTARRVVLTDDAGRTNSSSAIGNAISDNQGNANLSGAIGNAVFDNQGNANLSGARGNVILDQAGNRTITSAAGNNVTDGTNTSNYGAEGLVATDAAGNSTLVNQAGLSFTDVNGTATGPSITAAGINAGNSTISNVADGVAASDVATFGQLTAANATAGAKTDALGTSTANNLGGGATYTAADGKVSAPAYTLNNGNNDATTTSFNNVGSALNNLDGRTTTNTSNIANVQAQADKGFNISAAGGTANNVQLGETVDFTNTDGNLVATASANGINYNLAENIDLGKDGSIRTGNTTVNNAGITILNGTVDTVTLGRNGLNNGGNRITNLAAGVVADDAATFGQVTDVNNKVNTLGTSTASNLGGDAKYNAATGAVSAPTYTLDNGTNTGTTADFNNVGSALDNLNTRTTTNTGDIADLASGKTGLVRQDNGTGIITVGATTGGTVVDFANSTGVTRQLTGVASAGDYTIADNANNAVNAGDLNTAVNSVTDLGLSFAGDSGKNVQRKLGETLNVTGGETNPAALASGNNIGVSTNATNNGLLVQLAKDIDLGATGSLKTGNAITNNAGVTITDGANITAVRATGTNVTDGINTSNYGANGLTIAGGPSVTATGINAAGNKVSNVANGTDDGDAVNLGQLTAANATAGAKTDALGTSTANNLGGGATYNTKNGTVSAPTYTLNDGTNTGTNTTVNTVSDALGNLDGRTTTNTSNIANVQAQANRGINVGNGSTSNNFALGDTINVNGDNNLTSTTTADGVQVTLNKQVDLGPTGSFTAGNSVLNNTGLTIAGGPSVTATGINAAGNKVSNIADGTVAGDAVNLGQLTAANATAGAKTDALGTSTANNLGGNATYNAATGKVSAPAYTLDNGTVTATTVGGALSNLDGRTTTNTSNIANVQAQANKGFNISAAGGTANNVKLGETVDFTNTDGNLVATASGNGINYNLAENIDLGATGSLKTGNTVTNNAGVRIDDGMGKITAVTATGTNVTNGVNTSNYGANGLTIVGGPSVTTAGINAGNQAITNLADGVAATDAATKGQVDAVSSGLTDLTAGAVQYDRSNGNINYDNVIFAGTQAVIDQDEDGNDFVVSGGTRLSNVANGINAADAVNKGQLDGLIAQNVTNVEVNDQNGNPITVNITDQVVNRNKDNGNMDSLFLTYNVEGQNVTDHLTISETVQKMNTEGVKFAHTNAVNTKGNLGMTNDSSAGGINSTAIGVNAIVEAFADNTVALGHNTLATNMAKDSVVIGNSSQVAGESSIAIGNGAKALGNQSISIGTGNIVNGDNSGAFGDPSIINGDNSYSVGNNNTIDSNDTFVLGNNVTSTIGGSVVLGTGSAARTGAGVVGYLAAGNAAITATTSTTGAVAVGDAANGIYRQVTGVAAGTADSDAVNVSQLKAVSDTLQNNNAALSNAAVQYDKNADGTINKGSITLGGGAAGTTITNVAAGNVSAGSTDAVNGSQLHNLGNGVASIVGGDATFDAAGNLTASNIGGTGKGNISDAIAAVNQGNVQANENIKANTDRLDAGLSFGADSGTTINKPVGDTTALKFEGGNNITTTTTSSGIKFDLNGNINVDNITAGTVTTGNTTVNNNGVTIKDGPSMTTEGINAGGKTITGVADGIKVNDAVNLGQLTALDNKLSNSVNELGYKISEVEDDANAGISAAMAMSSLPQAYIPGKSMIGGGVATYNGQSAVAIGVSKVSDNGRWVIKANGTADTQGNAGGAIGAGFHF